MALPASRMAHPATVNNAFYDDLGDRWFEDDGHAIAILRAEGLYKTDYVRRVLAQAGIRPGRDGHPAAHVVDVACGGGLVSLPLAADGFRVTGIDAAEGALDVARRRVPPGADATFAAADVAALPLEDASADAVLLLDVLEHIESVPAALAEAARVLRPGGLVVFNTFNRTPVSAVVAVHALRLVAPDSPADLHVARYFVPPESLRASARYAGLRVDALVGMRPALGLPFWRSLARRRVDAGFRFTTTRSLALGYIGTATRVVGDW